MSAYISSHGTGAFRRVVGVHVMSGLPGATEAGMMRLRWERRPIALAHNGCETIAADADILGAWAVCKTPAALRDIFVWGWQVTHIESGMYLVADIENKAVARTIVSRIARLTDWSALPNPMDAPIEIKRRVYDIVGEVKRAHQDRQAERWYAAHPDVAVLRDVVMAAIS